MGTSVGFIGGGRIVRVILEGWRRAGRWPARVVVSDTEANTLETLSAAFPQVVALPGDNARAAGEEIVFLAVHPPVLRTVLGQLRGRVSPAALVISLAPKVTIPELAAALGGHHRVARMIPNAPSIVGAGFNPVSFAPALYGADRKVLADLMSPLGPMPEVTEDHLEAYALLTGMGPTYLWFQLYELQSLAEDFGLAPTAAAEAIGEMVRGALRTMTESGLPPADVMDLVPVRPLAEDEAAFKAAYRSRLRNILEKIRPAVAV